MIEIDNRKVDLTPELYAQLGEPNRHPDGGQVVAVEHDGAICWKGSLTDYFQVEEELRRNARLQAERHDVFLLFENGRVRL